MNFLKGAKIVKTQHVDRDDLQYYWQSLYMHDMLRWRFPDIKEPTWTDVQQVIGRNGENMYYLVDSTGEILTEITLELTLGKMALLHFSIRPLLHPRQKLFLGKFIPWQVLTKWHDDQGKPFVETLLGMTPRSNRAACMFVKKCGFTPIATVPAADGEQMMMTYLTRGSFNG